MEQENIVNILDDRINYFNIDGHITFNRNNLTCLYYSGLLENLKKYVDYYLSISKRKDCEYIDSGTTAAVFRVGDYAFKLLNKKYSKSKIICPDLYLFLKTYERDYVRNESGRVVGGIEVQPFLTRKIDENSSFALENYKSELEKLKYRINDDLIKSMQGNNVMLLNDYRNADTQNPEQLPNWFKENPIVLIDRDLVYKMK